MTFPMYSVPQELTVTVPVHALWHQMVKTSVSIKLWLMPENY